jgi:ankyrin repeat protein
MADLLNAADSGNVDEVRRLLARGEIDVNLQNRTGATALMYAVHNGSLVIVNMLLTARAKIDLQTQGGSTALMFAVKKEDMGMVNMLLSGGANVNIQDANGHTALYFAEIRWNTRLMARLIEGGADPTNLYRAEYPRMTALIASINEGNIEVAKAIIESKYIGDVNFQEPDEGGTALIHAVWRGNLELVNMLLAKGANPNLQNFEGETPLITLAARQESWGYDKPRFITPENFQPIFEALVASGADVNIHDRSETNGLGYVVDTPEYLQLFLREGANVNLQTEDAGYTPLMFASEGKLESVRLLLRAGANVNLQNLDGDTSLMIAASNGKLENVRLLLRAGADVNLRNQNGDTAEMIALNNRRFDIVNLLRAPARNIAALNAALGHRNERYEVGAAGESVGRIGNAGINYRREENGEMRRIPGNVMGLVGTFLSGKRGSVHEQATATRANAGPGPSAVLKSGAPSLKRRRRGRKTYKRR